MASAACERSPVVQPWTKPFLEIPLDVPPAGVTPSGESYAYGTGTTMPTSGGANDASPGDLDGDGQYERVLLWSPSNAKDNSQNGYTGPVYLDGYELGGERLWRIDLGRNIRAGAHKAWSRRRRQTSTCADWPQPHMQR